MSMKNNLQKLIDNHIKWLSDKTVLREVDEQWMEITTPYLDRHNDYLQIFIKREDGAYFLTDDGYILNDLINSGCSMDTQKRKELLKITLAGFGVQLKGDQLTIYANEMNFPLKKHNLIQAMLAVNDLFYLAKPLITNLFFEDVTHWMDQINVRYLSRIKLVGKTGYDHMFDFAIPKSTRSPERLIEVLNHPNKDAVESLVFKWMDTKDTRPPNSQLFAFLNNEHEANFRSIMDALLNYDLRPFLWTERAKATEFLVA